MVNLFSKRLFVVFISVFLVHTLFCQEPIKILPLGNSITYGKRTGDTREPYYMVGYRYKLYQLLAEAGYNFDFIGHWSSGGAYFPDPQNGGIPGIKAEGLASVLLTGKDLTISPTKTYTSGPYLNYYSPDIILLHIGTNDVNETLESTADDLDDILNEIQNFENNTGKTILVIVANIISFQTTLGNCDTWSEINAYNSSVTNLVNNRIANGDKLVLVDMQCGANINYNSDMFDKLHPNSSGEDKMGIKWFEAIDDLNSKPIVYDIPDQDKAEGQYFETINLNNYVDDIEDPDASITWTYLPQNPVNFNVTINSQKIATVSPKDTNWNGSETITFVATDNGNVISALKKSAHNSATFTVHGVNDAPVINSQSAVNVVEDKSVTVFLSSINVTDVDSDPSTFVLTVNDGEHYTHTGNIVKPDSNYNGYVEVNITVSDGALCSNVFKLRVDISPVNDPPSIKGQYSATVKEESSFEVRKSHLDIEDVDNDTSQLTLLVFDGVNYTRSGNTITPVKDFFGTLTVPVKIRDPYETSTMFDFKVQVENVNDPPVIILPANLSSDESSYYNEIIRIYDPDSTDFNLTKLSCPTWLTISENPGKMSGTPAPANVGKNTIKLLISDGYSTIDTTFYITVNNTNDPPKITSIPVASGDDYKSYYYKIQANDPNDDMVTYVAVQIPGWSTFNKNTGELTGIPKHSDVGNYTVKLKATDGKEDTVQQFYLTIQDINDTPKIVSTPKLVSYTGANYSYRIDATDEDENDSVTYLCLKKPDWLSYVKSSHILFGIPDSVDIGEHEVIFSVSDGKVMLTQKFKITVKSTSSIVDRSSSKLKIYPSPAQNYIHLITDDFSGRGRVMFFDLTGKLITEDFIEFTSGKGYLNLSELNQGIYFIKLETDDKIFSGKLIKN